MASDAPECCPECGGVITEKSVVVDGATIAAEMSWWYCLDCGWDNRSGKPEADNSDGLDGWDGWEREASVGSLEQFENRQGESENDT